jgi:hypothetical protein
MWRLPHLSGICGSVVLLGTVMLGAAGTSEQSPTPQRESVKTQVARFVATMPTVSPSGKTKSLLRYEILEDDRYSPPVPYAVVYFIPTIWNSWSAGVQRQVCDALGALAEKQSDEHGGYGLNVVRIVLRVSYTEIGVIRSDNSIRELPDKFETVSTGFYFHPSLASLR